MHDLSSMRVLVRQFKNTRKLSASLVVPFDMVSWRREAKVLKSAVASVLRPSRNAVATARQRRDESQQAVELEPWSGHLCQRHLRVQDEPSVKLINLFHYEARRGAPVSWATRLANATGVSAEEYVIRIAARSDHSVAVTYLELDRSDVQAFPSDASAMRFLDAFMRVSEDTVISKQRASTPLATAVAAYGSYPPIFGILPQTAALVATRFRAEHQACHSLVCGLFGYVQCYRERQVN
jgi:hypothetical protein